ncbi:MAG: aldo/keto reductase, partial [Clostridia bacterium]|nr:aldo/keto reductase [Clostridia bacterium]
MRFPVNSDDSVNYEETEKMIDYAIKNGVNYFDTAYVYHAGKSEIVLGDILKKYPRNSFLLADKYPGHQICDIYTPEETFKEQLERCQVDYFDYYLLHNINENSVKVYMDEKWGILDYFKEQKRLGKIKCLGFSCHCSVELLKEFLDYCGDSMEFCQIQLNYLDWTLQDGKAKYELLTERNIPIYIMEPLRGGKLATLSESQKTKLSVLRKNAKPVEWAFSFLLDLPNIKMILSGMSEFSQVKENIEIFKNYNPLNDNEVNTLLEIAEEMKDSVPCTGCGYCLKDCPQGLNIPFMLSIYNELKIQKAISVRMRLDGLPEEKQSTACIGCGLCEANCPQKISVPKELENLSELLKTMPTWAEICEERQRKMNEELRIR